MFFCKTENMHEEISLCNNAETCLQKYVHKSIMKEYQLKLVKMGTYAESSISCESVNP